MYLLAGLHSFKYCQNLFISKCFIVLCKIKKYTYKIKSYRQQPYESSSPSTQSQQTDAADIDIVVKSHRIPFEKKTCYALFMSIYIYISYLHTIPLYIYSRPPHRLLNHHQKGSLIIKLCFFWSACKITYDHNNRFKSHMAKPKDIPCKSSKPHKD
jgi:hypothetical protein